MDLQRLGDSDRSQMLALAERWSKDASPLVRRAAIAGVCEPRLLDRLSAFRQTASTGFPMGRGRGPRCSMGVEKNLRKARLQMAHPEGYAELQRAMSRK